MLKLFIVLVFPFSVFSQSVTEYHKMINEAEMLVIQDSFEMALSTYQKAFSQNSKPFSIDINNALLCAINLKDNELSSRYARQLIMLGCDLDFFWDNKFYKSFVASQHWLSLVYDYPDLRKEYKKTTNLVLRDKVISLMSRDQFWRQFDIKYTELKDSTFREDSIIMKELLEVFENDFPDEYDIGIQFNDKNEIELFSAIPIILLHSYTYSDNYKFGLDMTNDLLGFVRSGKLHPWVFAYLNDRSGGFILKNGYGSKIFYQVEDGYYLNKISPEVESNCQNNRLELGLEKMEDSQLKLKYQIQKNNGFQFFAHPPIIGLGLPKEVVEKVFIKYDFNSDPDLNSVPGFKSVPK